MLYFGLIYIIDSNHFKLGKEQEKGKLSHLPTFCASLALSAHDVLLDVCAKLSTGAVTVKDLQKMHEHKSQMMQLCSVIVTKKVLKKQDYTGPLERRLNELQEFMLRQDHLKFFCSEVSIPVQGMLNLSVIL